MKSLQWSLDQHLDVTGKICSELGYRLFIVPSPEDIPGVNRDFEECLHYRDEIWHTLDHAPVEGVWHEAGHALVAELMDCGMRDLGVHWIVYGKYDGLSRKVLHVSEENPACHATRGLMLAYDVPESDRKRILDYVSFDEEDEAPEVLAQWADVATTYRLSGIEMARHAYRRMTE